MGAVAEFEIKKFPYRNQDGTTTLKDGAVFVEEDGSGFTFTGLRLEGSSSVSPLTRALVCAWLQKACRSAMRSALAEKAAGH